MCFILWRRMDAIKTIKQANRLLIDNKFIKDGEQAIYLDKKTGLWNVDPELVDTFEDCEGLTLEQAEKVALNLLWSI